MVQWLALCTEKVFGYHHHLCQRAGLVLSGVNLKNKQEARQWHTLLSTHNTMHKDLGSNPLFPSAGEGIGEASWVKQVCRYLPPNRKTAAWSGEFIMQALVMIALVAKYITHMCIYVYFAISACFFSMPHWSYFMKDIFNSFYCLLVGWHSHESDSLWTL